LGQRLCLPVERLGQDVSSCLVLLEGGDVTIWFAQGLVDRAGAEFGIT
jgi:hypothetical protein